jgi:hypothetical protein
MTPAMPTCIHVCISSCSNYGDITVLEFFDYMEEPLTPIIERLYEQLIRTWRHLQAVWDGR